MRGLQQFRDHLAMQGHSRKTIHEYAGHLHRLDRWAQERGATLDELTAYQLLEYVETQVSPKRSTRIQLRQAVRWYQEANGLPATWGVVKAPREKPPICRALSPEDARRLFKAAYTWDTGPEGVAVLLGLQQGLRRAEIASLQWDGVSGDWSTLHFVGKGPKWAEVPLHPLVQESLQWWAGFTPRPSNNCVARTGPGESYLFAGRYAEHVTPTTVWTWAKRVGASIGLELTTHQLRHTFGAEVNDATKDLRATQRLMRHSKSTTTETYTRVDNERLWEALMSADYSST